METSKKINDNHEELTKDGLINKILYGNPFRMFDLSTKPKATTTASKKSKTTTSAFEKPPLIWAVAGYISYMFLFAVSWMRELLFGMGPLRGDVNKFRERPSREGYAPLYASFESFYTRKTT